MGPLTAMNRSPLWCPRRDVVPQIAQHAAGVGQLGAAQVDLVVCHPPHETLRLFVVSL